MSTPNFTCVRVDERADRVIVVLDRQSARNAIDLTMVQELHAICASLEKAPRPLLLTGAAGIFAAGADISQLRDRRSEDALQGINRNLFRPHRSAPPTHDRRGRWRRPRRRG